MNRVGKAVLSLLVGGGLVACAAIAGIDRFEGVPTQDGGPTPPLGDGAMVILPDGACVGSGCTDACSGASCPRTLVAGLNRPGALTLVGNSLVYVDSLEPEGADGGVSSLRAVAKTGGTPTVLTSIVIRPMLRTAAGDAGVPVAFEYRLAKNQMGLVQLRTDGGLEKLGGVDDLVTAAATNEWVVWSATNQRKADFAPRPGSNGNGVGENFDMMGLSGAVAPAALLFGAVDGGTSVSLYRLEMLDDGAGGTTPTATSIGKANVLSAFDIFTDGDRALVATQIGTLETVLRDAGKGPTVGPFGGAIIALHADADHVAVATETGIYLVDKRTNAFTLRHARKARGIVTDGTSLFWTEGAAIMTSPKL